jgi:serine/threonine protein kinase
MPPSASPARPTGLSAAVTRTRVLGAPAGGGGGRLLAPGQLVASRQSGLAYRVARLLGAGGFGQVYLVRRVGRSAAIPAELCLKVSERSDAWVREAYFGQLLVGHPRAIQVFEAFATVRADGLVLYCLALERALHGDLRAHLLRDPRGFSERLARREIAGVLEVLGKLHRGQVLHRDLTPMNVFVCQGPMLKLGDFGLVRQQSGRHGATVDALNPLMAPSDIALGAVPKWQARDDVYQVGQLIAMLVKGDARARVRLAEVRRLACSDQLKEIVYRCIGERRKRYETADALIEALRRPPAVLRTGRLVSLRGEHVAFTGILGRPRREAQAAARRAGAVVHGAPSARTSVVVRGQPNPLQAAGKDGGLKLMEIKRLRDKGQRIVLLNERQFWRLAARRGR